MSVTSRANIFGTIVGDESENIFPGERQRKDPALDGEMRLDTYKLHIFHYGNSTISKTPLEDELSW